MGIVWVLYNFTIIVLYTDVDADNYKKCCIIENVLDLRSNVPV